MEISGKYLGDCSLERKAFERQEEVLASLRAPDFQRLNEKKKGEEISKALLDLITHAKEPCFLLSAVTSFLEQIEENKLIEHYTFSHFEQWLNQVSGLSQEQNYKVRAKIVGKWLPRDAYQLFFPIGMNKTYFGPHFVTAHGSPDLDTTIASFWGWVDAFAARVAQGVHLWNIPGGAPAASIEVGFLFHQVFGTGVFHHLSKAQSSLSVSSVDLLSQKEVSFIHRNQSTLSLDHEQSDNAIILVDDQGYYLGDWRHFDVEGVKGVIQLLNHCLHWLENHLYLNLFSLFSKKKITRTDLHECIRLCLDRELCACAPAKKFTARQRQNVETYLRKILQVNKGIKSTFEEFVLSMKESSLFSFETFLEHIDQLERSSLFDASGDIKENRPLLFEHLEKIITSLHHAIEKMDVYVDRLEIALKIKNEIFGHQVQTVSYQADSEEARSKMKNHAYLTVTYSDKEGKIIPLGILSASDLYRSMLGTVSLRDFCNREETKIPSYLEVISVIDHHKSHFISSMPPVAWIADAQSSNALIAELSFQINDKYSTAGMSIEEIKQQIEEKEKNCSTSSDARILRRLYGRLVAASLCPHYYISPEREFLEYLHYVYAILDDTDLLTKVSRRDVECMASLLNRLKSLMLKMEVEIIDFDDLLQSDDFVQNAAKKIMQNFDMYSLYRKIYLEKEHAVEANLKWAAKGEPSTFFSDTKIQNVCCRVGQTKLFSASFPLYEKYAELLRKNWYTEACHVFKEKSEIDLHLHMISTVAGAEDLFAGAEKEEKHKDELWIWNAQTETGAAHLRTFLNNFHTLPLLEGIDLEVTFYGENAAELERLFKENFPRIRYHLPKKASSDVPIILLKFKAGAINSRKAMISPYLPKWSS